MIRIFTAAAVAALACPPGHAASFFSVPIAGTYTAEYDAGVFPDKCPGVDFGLCDISTSFSGLLQVITPGSTDATYTSGVTLAYSFADINDFAVINNLLAGSPSNGEVTATIVNGGLTGLSADADGDGWTLTMSQGAFDWHAAGSHLGAEAVGTYALAAPVPEPTPAALLALAVAGFALRRLAKRRGMGDPAATAFA